MVNVGQSQSQKSKAQASFEFILILLIVVFMVTVFILAISEEYPDTFVLSSIKSTVESEISTVVLNQPECQDTRLVSMGFSKTDKTISLKIHGCEIDLPKVAALVETKLCGAATPTGGTTLICGGVIYTISGEFTAE